MPSDFPRSPKLLKGALVVYESQTPGPPPKVIVFQYNPEQLSRRARPAPGAGHAGVAALPAHCPGPGDRASGPGGSSADLPGRLAPDAAGLGEVARGPGAPDQLLRHGR